MPNTCAKQPDRHDVVSHQHFKPRESVRIQHVLQQLQSPVNHTMLRVWTAKIIQNIKDTYYEGRSTTELDKLTTSLSISPHRVWLAVFMLLLNIDHIMKDEILQTDDTRNARKIVRFFIDLKHEAVSNFLSNDTQTLSDFVDVCEELYVIA